MLRIVRRGNLLFNLLASIGPVMSMNRGTNHENVRMPNFSIIGTILANTEKEYVKVV